MCPKGGSGAQFVLDAWGCRESPDRQQGADAHRMHCFSANGGFCGRASTCACLCFYPTLHCSCFISEQMMYILHVLILDKLVPCKVHNFM